MESYFGEHTGIKYKTIEFLYCMWGENVLQAVVWNLSALHSFALLLPTFNIQKYMQWCVFTACADTCLYDQAQSQSRAYCVFMCVFRLIFSSPHTLTETNGFWSHASLWHSYQYFPLTSMWPQCSCWHRDNVIMYWGLFMALFWSYLLSFNFTRVSTYNS